MGGAKISDKIEVLNNFIDKADAVAVVGALGNNFLLAEGLKVGQSLVEPEALDQTKQILEKSSGCRKKRETFASSCWTLWSRPLKTVRSLHM